MKQSVEKYKAEGSPANDSSFLLRTTLKTIGELVQQTTRKRTTYENPPKISIKLKDWPQKTTLTREPTLNWIRLPSNVFSVNKNSQLVIRKAQGVGANTK